MIGWHCCWHHSIFAKQLWFKKLNNDLINVANHTSHDALHNAGFYQMWTLCNNGVETVTRRSVIQIEIQLTSNSWFSLGCDNWLPCLDALVRATLPPPHELSEDTAAVMKFANSLIGREVLPTAIYSRNALFAKMYWSYNRNRVPSMWLWTQISGEIPKIFRYINDLQNLWRLCLNCLIFGDWMSACDHLGLHEMRSLASDVSEELGNIDEALFLCLPNHRVDEYECASSTCSSTETTSTWNWLSYN